MQQAIKFTVNGQEQTVTTDPDRPLLEVLREDLRLTGPQFGCGEQQCGACTVLINGRNVTSCTLRVGNVEGRNVTTIEGLAADGQLHPVQQAFLDEGALQCGYCTPGMILAAVSLLDRTPQPSDTQIRRRMQRNLCRCGGYVRILRAVHRAAETTGTDERAEP